MEWQPIETAPKDGIILLYRPGAFPAGMRVRGGYYSGVDGAPYWASDNFCEYGERNCRDFSPTHWMPLPEPPSK